MPVFLSRQKRPIDRTTLHLVMKKFGAAAGVPGRAEAFPRTAQAEKLLRPRPRQNVSGNSAEGFKRTPNFANYQDVPVIESYDVAPRPTPDVYTFSREMVQRNLYRIPLP